MLNKHEPLTREQVERACIGLLNDVAIKGQMGLTTTIVLLSAHDAALRQQLAAVTHDFKQVSAYVEAMNAKATPEELHRLYHDQTLQNAARAYKALERQLATTTAHLEAQRTATYQAVAREHEAKQQLAAVRQALVEVRTEMDQLKEQVIEVVQTERQAVWEEAAKAWDGMEYSELAKAYPIGKYPKWGNIFAMWCREQARKEQP